MNTVADATMGPLASVTRSQPRTISRKYRTLQICAWAGPIFLIGQVLSWGYLGLNLPPLEPGVSISDLYAHYVDHSLRIRVAMMLSCFVVPFYFAWSAVISRVMRRIEGEDSPLPIIEQMGGDLTVVIGLVGAVCWLTGAYHVTERTPEIVRALHDFGWFFFDVTYTATSLQMVALGWAFLSDPRREPLIPRWVSWYSLFCATTLVPLSLLPFFYSGPFAWSGLICYWVSLGTWFFWILILSFWMFKAITRLSDEDAAGVLPEALAHA